MTILGASPTAKPGGPAFNMLGFRVAIPWNTLIGILIIAVLWYPEFSRRYGGVGQWLLAVAFALLLVGSILLHELAHALTARAMGYPVTGVTLWALGGFTTFKTGRNHGPGRAATIAAAGPGATLSIAVLAGAAASALPHGTFANEILAALSSANAVIGVFNLLPGSPLDGGAIVESIVWAFTGSMARGQLVAAWIGRVLAVIVGASPFVVAAAVGGQPSLSLLLIALVLAVLLWTGASASLAAARSSERLRSVPAASLAQPVAAVSSDATVAMSLAQQREGVVQVVIGYEGVPLGIVRTEAAAAVPAQERDRLGVLAVCVSLTDLPLVEAGGTAWDVLTACQESDARFVGLRDERSGQVLGVVDTDAMFVTMGQ
ncbi:MAG: site-2 protease family protein [Candidatus Nanopelagicales bacterium]|nr:site-2 protease family protein [Candidatus Nanopelagicales bacterium]MDZ4250068.1 site-2 protease family protein [Candidatus Nanopelagicales bacterium]